MAKFIVTGAGGLVGGALVEHLLHRGHEVVGLTRTPDPRQHASYQNVVGDLLQGEKLPALPGYHDALIHLAWAGSMGPEREDFALQASNVTASVAAVEWAKACNAGRFVGVGTITEAEVAHPVFSLGRTPGPGYVYGLMKTTARHATRYKAAQLSLAHSWARLGNTYFPGDKTGRFLISTLEKLMAGEAVSSSEGTQPYDFVALRDALGALEALGLSAKDGGSYYIGSGHPRPLRDFLNEAAALASYPGKITFGAPAPIALAWGDFSIASLIEATGFIPRVSFAQGVREIIEDLRKA